MSDGTERIRRSEHALLAADAWIFTAAISITLTAAIELGLLAIFGSGPAVDQRMSPLVGQTLTFVAAGLAVFGGAFVAWRLHGRSLDWPVAGSMLGGAVVGTALALPAFVFVWMGLSSIGRIVNPGRFENGPWFEVGLIVVLVALVVGWMVFDAVRDIAREKRHALLDWLRIGAAALVIALAGVILPWVGAAQGSELGEAGLFMLPFAVAGGLAAVGADLLDTWRRRRRERAHSALPA